MNRYVNRVASILIATTTLLVVAVSPARAVVMEFYNIPLLFNAYPGSNFTEAEAKAALKRVNEIYKPAKVKFTLQKYITPGMNPGNNDSSWTDAEGFKAMRDGEKELKNTVGKDKGVKVNAAGQPDPNNNVNGWAILGKPVVAMRENSDGAEKTAQTMAHELGHALGLSGDREDNGSKGDIMYYSSKGRTGTKFTDMEKADLKKTAKKRGKIQKSACPPGSAMPPTTTGSKGSGIGTATQFALPISYDRSEFVEMTLNDVTANIEVDIWLSDLVPPAGPLAEYWILFDADNNIGTGQNHAGFPGIDNLLQVQLTPPNILNATLFDEFLVPIPTGVGSVNLLNQPKFVSDETILPGTPGPLPQPGADLIQVELVSLSLVASDPVMINGPLVSPIDDFGILYSPEVHLEGPQVFSSFGEIDPFSLPIIDVNAFQFQPNEFVDVFLDDDLVGTFQTDPLGQLNVPVQLPVPSTLAEHYFVTVQSQTQGGFGFFALGSSVAVTIVPVMPPMLFALLGVGLLILGHAARQHLK